MKQKNNFYLSVSIQSKEILFLTLSYLSAIETRIEFEFNLLLLFSESSSTWTCFTVEPMVNEGSEEFVEHNIPGSTIKYYSTADGKLSAQFEHTILLTDTGYEILTLA